MHARFVQGNPQFIDITPDADIAAGEIVVLNSLILIAHSPIAAGANGALAIGGGIYELTCGSATATFGDVACWAPAPDGRVYDVSTSGYQDMGFFVSNPAYGQLCNVYHQNSNYKS